MDAVMGAVMGAVIIEMMGEVMAEVATGMMTVATGGKPINQKGGMRLLAMSGSCGETHPFTDGNGRTARLIMNSYRLATV